MPYDPQGMQPTQQRPWWEQPRQMGRPVNMDNPPNPSANRTSQPASLLQMLLTSPLMKKGGLAQKGMQGGAPSGSFGAIPGMGAMNFTQMGNAPEALEMGAYGGMLPWTWLGGMGGK